MHRQARWSYVACLLAVALAGCGDGGAPSDLPVSPTLTAFATSSLALDQTATVDLDAGVIAPRAETDADLWFEAVEVGERYLTPQNGARFAPAGNTAPGVSWCQAASLSAARIPLASLAAGRYLCGTTTRNQLVEIRIDEPAADYVPGSNVVPVLKMTVTSYW
jgi:hypothetical protein